MEDFGFPPNFPEVVEKEIEETQEAGGYFCYIMCLTLLSYLVLADYRFSIGISMQSNIVKQCFLFSYR